MNFPGQVARRPYSDMPRTLGDMVRTSEILGQRHGLDKDGHLRLLPGRPWHSYRGARRRLMRPFFQKACHRRIDPAGNLAHLAAVGRHRASLMDMARRLAAHFHRIEVQELERAKLGRAA